jgi:3',5'-cyclic AMP phosphodiesterase CpdA
MTRIAHLTDLHILEQHHRGRPVSSRFRLRFLSTGRPLDAAARKHRAARALDRVRRAGADHVVITGDLTEDGTEAQFEVVAELLAASGLPPGGVTLIPGNHDGYDNTVAWARALDGPLKPWAATSHDGAVCELADAWVVAVPTPLEQHYVRSAGRLRPGQAHALGKLATSAARAAKALVIAQHHPPLRTRWAGVHWWDGLVGCERLMRELSRHAHAHVLHGHVHRSSEARLPGRSHRQIFSAAAVVDHPDPVRLYDIADGRLSPVPAAIPIPAPTPSPIPIPIPIPIRIPLRIPSS